MILFILKMLLPIRCFSCGKIVGNKWEPYKKLLEDGFTEKDALDKLDLKNICCRIMILTYVENE